MGLMRVKTGAAEVAAGAVTAPAPRRRNADKADRCDAPCTAPPSPPHEGPKCLSVHAFCGVAQGSPPLARLMR